MEIKKLIVEEEYGDSISIRFIDELDLSWDLDGREWVLYNHGKRVPSDYKVVYTCEKCLSEGIDYLHFLKTHKYEAICKKCRNDNNDYNSEINFNGWTEVNGQKVQGPFEEMVANWLYDHNIEFQTHGKIEKSLYYTSIQEKRRKFSADFYLPKYDLFLEPHSVYKDFQFEKKIEELQDQSKILVLDWNDWENQLTKLISSH